MSIILPVLFVIIFSAALGWAARKVCRNNARKQIVFSVLSLVIIILYICQSFSLLKILPLTDAIIWLNWLIPGVGLLLGSIWDRLGASPIRRYILSAVLIILAFHQSYGFLYTPVPECVNVWTDGVCLQTSKSSCSAAAAATLLKCYGIEATEDEMARLCFTTVNGTHSFGIYRGLRMKTSGTPYTVEVINSKDMALVKSGMSPMLITAGVPFWGMSDKRYEKDWGWQRGVNHSVVVFDVDIPGYIDVGDPSIGREHWSLWSLEDIWHGKAFRLVKRQ